MKFTKKDFFFVLLLILTLALGTYLWIKYTEGEDTNLLIRIIWYTPSYLILLCWWIARRG